MTTALQDQLRAAELPSHLPMDSFRVGGPLSKYLPGTAGDEIMSIGGWKTESVAKYHIGLIACGKTYGSKRKRSPELYTPTLASCWPLSLEFEKDFASCAGTDRGTRFRKFGRDNLCQTRGWLTTRIIQRQKDVRAGPRADEGGPPPLQYLHYMIHGRRTSYTTEHLNVARAI